MCEKCVLKEKCKFPNQSVWDGKSHNLHLSVVMKVITLYPLDLTHPKLQVPQEVQDSVSRLLTEIQNLSRTICTPLSWVETLHGRLFPVDIFNLVFLPTSNVSLQQLQLLCYWSECLVLIFTCNVVPYLICFRLSLSFENTKNTAETSHYIPRSHLTSESIIRRWWKWGSLKKLTSMSMTITEQTTSSEHYDIHKQFYI